MGRKGVYNLRCEIAPPDYDDEDDDLLDIDFDDLDDLGDIIFEVG